MIRVLVVEDDHVAAEAHRAYVERVEGFSVVGVVHSGDEALRFLASRETDLVLLDMHLPDTHGLQVARAMRAAGHSADVIAVTSARDLGVVRSAVSQGIMQYLLKPFTFASLRDKLERYAAFRGELGRSGEASSQNQVDRALGLLRGTDAGGLPKGMSADTLDAIMKIVQEAAESRSAAEVAEAAGTSRVTARRYLEYLADHDAVDRRPRYGGTGRPELEYRWSKRAPAIRPGPRDPG